jgi:hypothetical protein
MKTRLAYVIASLLITLMLSLNSAASCPVCFGALDDPATQGMNVAILTLLGVTGSVLAGFLSFFLRLRRLSRSSAASRGDD